MNVTDAPAVRCRHPVSLPGRTVTLNKGGVTNEYFQMESLNQASD